MYLRTSLILIFVLGVASAARGDGPGPIPSGSSWWCIDASGATGRCERTRTLCDADVASMPWGGVPPPCVSRSSAYCSTYSAGAFTSPPSPSWLCRRDLVACDAALAEVRAQHPPPASVSASACASTP